MSEIPDVVPGKLVAMQTIRASAISTRFVAQVKVVGLRSVA